ncbi:cytochrome-c peroxidase [Sanyastnella coralliicola]|uniref:cytochrome-c peroxidase n=1 Tax=Sanyastnella coralliicola TaxID=3069118 RepID=UPI0027B94EE1|nr:cytochrome c peroxidase [Longitalea sp. SCSIO 12813]
MRLDKSAILCIIFLGSLATLTSCRPDDEQDNEEVTEISALPASIVYPSDNPYSNAKFELGQLLFWDPVLSGTNEVACATCHHPSLGYSDGRALSSGVNGQGLGPNRTGGVVVKRNSPTVINTAYNGISVSGTVNPMASPMFWDNRASSLEEQALLPMLSAEEMRGVAIAESDILDTLVNRLLAIAEYRNLFEAAFGSDEITETRIAQALANFQREIVANNSPFDRYMRGNMNAMTNAQVQGMNTFIESGCADCHGGPMFSDYELHTLSTPNHPQVEDEGATGNFDFRTPTLRNLAFTEPYMHNGVFDDLEEVLEFYRDISGGNANSQNPDVANNQIDQDARDLRVNGDDMDEIIVFLNALNDPDFDTSIPSSVPSGLPVGGEIN